VWEDARLTSTETIDHQNNSGNQSELVGNEYVRSTKTSIKKTIFDTEHNSWSRPYRQNPLLSLKSIRDINVSSLRLLVTQILRIWKLKITSAGKVRSLSQAFITSVVRPYGVWQNACHRNMCDLTRNDHNCALHFTAGRHADVIDSVRELPLPLLMFIASMPASRWLWFSNKSRCLAKRSFNRETNHCRWWKFVGRLIIHFFRCSARYHRGKHTISSGRAIITHA